MTDEHLRKRPEGSYIPRNDDHLILCRCEEITRGDIRKAIHSGLRTINEIKRETRAGMGLCQGQTCTRIIRAFIASELGCSLAEVGLPTPRTPVRPLSMMVLAADGMNKEAN
ncbi:(2Fe-2S)-binding protein [Desulfocicer niacini]